MIKKNFETENVRSNRTKFFGWHKFLCKEFLRNFFGKKCKNGKNLWFFECHVFRVGDTIFFMKHKTWSLSRERFLVFMNFLYKIFLYHYFARNEIKIKLWFLGKRYGFSGIWGDQVHQWTIRIFWMIAPKLISWLLLGQKFLNFKSYYPQTKAELVRLTNSRHRFEVVDF